MLSNNNITVIGIGKLGLGFSLLLERGGYNVLGVDIFPEYVEALNNKKMKCSESQYNELIESSKNFKATTNLEEGLNNSNIIFIIVQTPNGGGSKFYDHTILSNLLEKINKLKPKNKHFIIGCTVMPHYIDDIARIILCDSENCTINYNPEFIAQGDIVRGFENPDMILVGTHNEEELSPLIREIYGRMANNMPIYNFMTPLEAEIVKISLNGFITTKISFANMISDLCDATGADKKTVLNAIGSDSRIGQKYFQPGLSFGGPCFPRDTKALKQLMEQHDIQSNILRSTTEYNEEHNRIYAEIIAKNKNQKEDVKKTLKCYEHKEKNGDVVYTFSDVCYKPNTRIPIIEESSKLKIAEILVKKYKLKVIIKDIPILLAEVKKEYGSIFEYEIDKIE